MKQLTKHRIAIEIKAFDFDWDDRVKNMAVKELFKFYLDSPPYLLGCKHSWENNVFIIYVAHPELEKVPEAQQCNHYNLSKAREKYPYLFVDTNPLLYRQFYSRDSWYKRLVCWNCGHHPIGLETCPKCWKHPYDRSVPINLNLVKEKE